MRAARLHALTLVLLAVLVAIPYTQTLDDEWHYDDPGELTPGVRAFAPNVPPHHYRGIVVLWTWALDYRFFGENPAAYHVTNLTIHLACALLVYWTAWMLLAGVPRGRWLGAAAAAAIFAVHPLATQAVTYLTQRSTSLAALFFLLSLDGWIAFRRGGRRWGYVLSLAALAVGLYTKPVVVLLPAAIAGYELLFRPGGLRRAALLLLPFLLLAGRRAVDFVPRLAVEPPAPAAPAPQPMLPRYDRGEYARAQAISIPTYLRLFVFPKGQNLDWDVRPPRGWTDPAVLRCAALAAALLAVAAIARRRRAEPVAFGIALFFLALIPTSSLVPSADPLSEHRAYLPMAGLCLAVGAIGQALGRRSAAAAGVAAAIVVVTLTIVTARRNAVWDTELSLWTDVAAKSPDKERPHVNRGLALRNAGRIAEAEREYRRAIEIRPDYAFAWNNLGNVLRVQGRAAEAEQAFLAAAAARPAYPSPIVNLGNLDMDRGDPVAAEARYREALGISPGSVDATYNLAKALERQGRPGEAIPHYEELVARFPRDARYFNDLGCARLLAGDPPGAARDLGRATELSADWAVPWYNLGLARKAEGDSAAAARAFRTARRISPDLGYIPR